MSDETPQRSEPSVKSAIADENTWRVPNLSAIVALGGLTILSALVFRELRAEDGDSVSQYAIHAGV